MKAVVLYEHGGNERLVFEPQFSDPVPQPGEVIVRVRASSLNYHDVFTRKGMPGIRLSFPVIMGLDVAGEISGVGPDVADWKVGDRVLVDPIDRVAGGLIGETRHGGLAEQCRVPAHQLISLPDAVSFEQAAALPVAYGTAIRMINTIGRIQSGERVLILGASGGVGVAAAQLAKIAGAEVIAAVGSTEKAEALHALGVDHTILYRDTDFVGAIHEQFGKPARRRHAPNPGGVDVVVNFTGGDTWVKSLKCLRIGGRILTCGATAGYAPPEDLRYIWTFELQVRGSNGWERDDIHQLLALAQQGKLQVPISGRYPLHRAADALARIEERNVIGKVLVTP